MGENPRPLAFRMRPRTFDEFVGQEDIMGREGVLRRAIESGKLFSCILFGPTGTGKTSVVNLMERYSNLPIIRFSAATMGFSELKPILRKAGECRRKTGKPIVLFMDEIHRFNKLQQDILLPHVEEGNIILVGSTTENPSFEINPALLSRCRVLIFRKLRKEEIKLILKRAIEDERGYGGSIEVEEKVLDVLSESSDGDARVALNNLELLVDYVSGKGKRKVNFEDLEEISDETLKKLAKYRKKGEEHYDLISAFQKSIRGSDPDAALYYLARMLEAGEDPLYIARRLIRCASEDIGLADPMALLLAVSAYQAVYYTGMPEATTALAEATVYLSYAPKSNSLYVAYEKAVEIAKKTPNEPVPLKLRNPVTGLMKSMGYGEDYKYAHDYEGGFVRDNYLPDRLKGIIFYKPTKRGKEKKIADRLEKLWKGMKNYGSGSEEKS